MLSATPTVRVEMDASFVKKFNVKFNIYFTLPRKSIKIFVLIKIKAGNVENIVNIVKELTDTVLKQIFDEINVFIKYQM